MKNKIFFVIFTLIVIIFWLISDTTIQSPADWYSNNLGLWMENNRYNPSAISFGIVSGIILFGMIWRYISVREDQLKNWNERDKHEK